MASFKKPHNISLGKAGEEYAVAWLERQDFIILDRNYKYGRYELDILAAKENILCGIEVKTRSNANYGWPEEYISTYKMQQMKKAGEIALEKYTDYLEIQLFVLSIVLEKNKVDILFEEVAG